MIQNEESDNTFEYQKERGIWRIELTIYDAYIVVVLTVGKSFTN